MNYPTIGFIGAGKVGTALGTYFIKNGYTVAGYLSRSISSATRAAMINSTKVFETLEALVKECDMIFITTPDDAIVKVWGELKSCGLKGKMVCHASGSLSSKAFEDISATGASGYSIHPMYAFSDPTGRAPGFENAFFTIEGDENRLAEVQCFISKMGNRSLTLDSEHKTLYHVSNVLAANMVLALLKAAADCMGGCGVDESNAISAMMPMILGNINNIARKGFVSSLTGPVERADIGTVEKHLEVLPQQYRNIYAELSLVLSGLAKEKHPDRDYSRLEQLLLSADH